MSFYKPQFRHPSSPENSIGLTSRAYEGAISTLCAGCGHDSISAAVIQAVWGLNIEPHRVAKVSGIGCSSKSPTYFLDKTLLTVTCYTLAFQVMAIQHQSAWANLLTLCVVA